MEKDLALLGDSSGERLAKGVWHGGGTLPILNMNQRACRQPCTIWNLLSRIFFFHKDVDVAPILLYIHEFTNHHLQLHSLADNQYPIFSPTTLVVTGNWPHRISCWSRITHLGPPSSSPSYHYVFVEAKEGPL